MNRNSLNRLLARGSGAPGRNVPLIGTDSRTIRDPSMPQDSADEPSADTTERGGPAASAHPDIVRSRRLPARPVGRPSRSVVATLDGGHRLAAVKITDLLGWRAGDALRARCEPGHVTIWPGRPTEPTELPVTFDSRKHLRLPPTAVATLGVSAKAQVFAVGAADGALVLANATVVAELVTGVVHPDPQRAPAPPEARNRPSAARALRHTAAATPVPVG